MSATEIIPTANDARGAHSLRRFVRRPRGRIPADTKAWLAVNGENFWKLAVCKCGRWYHGMDHLAPYHTEKNWCPKCGIKQDWNGPDA